MIRIRYFAVVLAILFISAVSTPAAVKLASPFGEHMVLQQGIPIPIWGTATGGGEWVTVRFAGQTVFTISDAEGKWTACLAPLKAGGPYNMTVSENWYTLQLNDVLVGEVWMVAAGSGTGGMTIDAGIAPLSRFVRMYRVDSHAGAGGKWMVTSPESAREYSATTYFLGRGLYNKLKVPIGLIDVAYEGSSAQAWIGSKALAANPDLRFLLDIGGTH